MSAQSWQTVQRPTDAAPQAWQYAAALRALSARGWRNLSAADRATIDRWEGRS